MEEAREAAVSLVLGSLQGAPLCCCATVLSTALSEQLDELVQAAAQQLANRYGAALHDSGLEAKPVPRLKAICARGLHTMIEVCKRK